MRVDRSVSAIARGVSSFVLLFPCWKGGQFNHNRSTSSALLGKQNWKALASPPIMSCSDQSLILESPPPVAYDKFKKFGEKDILWKSTITSSS